MTLHLPKIIGHRGAAGYAPENSLVGIHTAADLGVTWVELDVKLTRDDVPVIFHDDTLERTTNGSGPMALTLFDDLRALDAGHWYAEGFTGMGVPTLEEAVDVILGRGLGLNLEIKPCAGRERETAEAALDCLSQIWDDPDKLLISSFSHVSLEAALDMMPNWHRALLLETQWPENWAELSAYLQVACVNINGNTCTREMVEAIADLNYGILAYTINNPTRARQLYSWGVDGVFSDDPDLIAI